MSKNRSTTSRRGPSARRPGGGTILLLVVVVIAVAILSPTINQLIQQQQRIRDLQQGIADTSAQITELHTERARWDDPAYVKQQARGRLLLVEPGDTTYVVVDRDPSVTPVAPVEVSVEQQATQSDPAELYLGTLIQSANADEAPQPPASDPAPTPGATGPGPDEQDPTP